MTKARTTGIAVVLGGMSKPRRRVAERLRATGVPVRAAARSVGPRSDWEDPSTRAPAL